MPYDIILGQGRRIDFESEGAIGLLSLVTPWAATMVAREGKIFKIEASRSLENGISALQVKLKHTLNYTQSQLIVKKIIKNTLKNFYFFLTKKWVGPWPPGPPGFAGPEKSTPLLVRVSTISADLPLIVPTFRVATLNFTVSGCCWCNSLITVWECSHLTSFLPCAVPSLFVPVPFTQLWFEFSFTIMSLLKRGFYRTGCPSWRPTYSQHRKTGCFYHDTIIR